jgi:ABC-type glutathione transport system ATPase component
MMDNRRRFKVFMFIQEICIRNSNFSCQFIILLSKRKTTIRQMLSVDLNSVSVVKEETKRKILSNIKFEIDAGKIYTILGKNGSGKSTLIKSLTSLLPKDEYETTGKIIFKATDLLDTTTDKLKKIRKNNIRYVFQDAVNSYDPLIKIKYYFDLTNVSPLKIEELLIYFLLPTYKKISELHSYELSGGMAQRLLIVLALLANPDLLILDEPTSGVDYAVMNLILLKMKNFVRDNDKSVLIVTQDINFALKSSDYIAHLSNGNLSEFFTPDKLINSPEDKVKNFIDSFKEISNVPA